MIRRYYPEWGRGPDRTVKANDKLADLWKARYILHAELSGFAPFGPDYLALSSTLDHLNHLADHFGVERVPPPGKPPGPAAPYRVP